MPQVSKIVQVPFTAQQMYDLINDIEAYPQFLPWCKTATIHTRDATKLEASLCIGKGLVTQTISTSNTMVPNAQIKMQYKAGPFKRCAGSWDFVPAENDHCKVVFNIDYEFRSILTAMTMEPIFNPITNTMIDAFYKRAQTIYGK
ncbi:MAG TPA: type II toxin-antitoxin system RatA family toxin [Gammaproteobacteria bacterium]|nr:type II toxin-antitoxin system RatA family toxin [Gammaproteobacteria bacterium]